MLNFFLGMTVPFIVAYVGIGVWIMVENFSARPGSGWARQHRSPFVRSPLTSRSWVVFLALWLPTPVLWPIIAVLGRLDYWYFRRAHNRAAHAQREQD